MRDPITLANAVLPGAGYVHLNRPAPVPCRITLSPGTPQAETVPVYLCSDDEVPVVQLGHGSGPGARVVLARAHAAGSPVRVKTFDLEDAPGLPPFSGRDGACPKCGCRCAETKWLAKPLGTMRRAKDWDPSYTVYLVGGDLAKANQYSFLDASPASWYPDEWQSRHCLICGFRWDEALAEQEAP